MLIISANGSTDKMNAAGIRRITILDVEPEAKVESENAYKAQLEKMMSRNVLHTEFHHKERKAWVYSEIITKGEGREYIKKSYSSDSYGLASFDLGKTELKVGQVVRVIGVHKNYAGKMRTDFKRSFLITQLEQIEDRDYIDLKEYETARAAFKAFKNAQKAA